jgi:hypothetical protein
MPVVHATKVQNDEWPSIDAIQGPRNATINDRVRVVHASEAEKFGNYTAFSYIAAA